MEGVGWGGAGRTHTNREKGRSGGSEQLFVIAMHIKIKLHHAIIVLSANGWMDDKMAHCALCSASLCGNVARRGVTGNASRHVLPVVQDLFIHAQGCFRKAEKLLKLKKNEKEALESELEQIIKQSREEQALRVAAEATDCSGQSALPLSSVFVPVIPTNN